MFDLMKIQGMFCRQLSCQSAITSDRPLHQLREEGHEQRIFQEIMIRLLPSPVHIQKISQRLERIIRNSKRQDQMQHGKVLSGQRIHICDHKICIFQERQHAQIQQNPCHNDPFCFFLFFFSNLFDPECSPERHRR